MSFCAVSLVARNWLSSFVASARGASPARRQAVSVSISVRLMSATDVDSFNATTFAISSSRTVLLAFNSASRALNAASRCVNTASVAVLNAVHTAFSTLRASGIALASRCHSACSSRTLAITSRACASVTSAFARSINLSRFNCAKRLASNSGASNRAIDLRMRVNNASRALCGTVCSTGPNLRHSVWKLSSARASSLKSCSSACSGVSLLAGALTLTASRVAINLLRASRFSRRAAFSLAKCAATGT